MKIHSKKSNMVKTVFFWAVHWNFEKFAWWVARLCLTGRAPLGPLLGHFQVSKWSKSRLVGKVCESTCQNNYNFWIWWSFALSKIKSPKTAFCVSKKWQKVIFCLFFDFLEAQNFTKSQVHPWACVNFHEKYGNADFFSKWSCQDEGSCGGWDPLMEKTCVWHKKFTNDKIFSKFLEIWAGSPQSSTMLIQRGFGQNLEWIGCFPSFFVLWPTVLGAPSFSPVLLTFL